MRIIAAARQATFRIWDRFNLRWPQEHREFFNRHIQYAIDEATAEKDAEIARLRQELFFTREYLDQARSWFRQIMEEADACPNTIEEWRYWLCSGDVGTVSNYCKAALTEIPEGVEVVYRVRQMLDKAKAGAGEGETA